MCVAKVDAEQSAKRELRKHQMELMKQGKKPYYLKKCELFSSLSMLDTGQACLCVGGLSFFFFFFFNNAIV